MICPEVNLDVIGTRMPMVIMLEFILNGIIRDANEAQSSCLVVPGMLQVDH